MKRVFLIIPILAIACLMATAQRPDYRQFLMEHPEHLAGTDYLCPTSPVPMTKAPKGYKPFYISHYGRHGARYAWQSDIYDSLRDFLAGADSIDNLTPAGKEFFRKFETLYPDVRYNIGELSHKGWVQQQELASLMYENFPKVFTDDARVEAATSPAGRCIMTMSSFCAALQGKNPDMEVEEHLGNIYLPAILPLNASNPFIKEFEKQEVLVRETWEEYIARKIDTKELLGKILKDVDKSVAPEDRWMKIHYLYFFINGMGSLDTDLDFTDIFTLEQRIALWEIDAFQFYTRAWGNHMGFKPIVDDIIAKADDRIASGEKGADLRFGHDSSILPLMMVLNVNGFGTVVADSDIIPVYCQPDNVPMGANLQMVFYRSKNNPEILFKVLFNGQEAHIGMETETWPYYNWNEFKAWMK